VGTDGVINNNIDLVPLNKLLQVFLLVNSCHLEFISPVAITCTQAENVSPTRISDASNSKGPTDLYCNWSNTPVNEDAPVESIVTHAST
jgi:hypothetical protein